MTLPDRHTHIWAGLRCTVRHGAADEILAGLRALLSQTGRAASVTATAGHTERRVDGGARPGEPVAVTHPDFQQWEARR